MKEGIHPKYYEVEARCACGATWKTHSTKQELHLEICSACHPFYTGRQKILDTEGRVERFTKKFGAQTSEARKQAAAAKRRRSRKRRRPRFVRPRCQSAAGLTGGRSRFALSRLPSAHRRPSLRSRRSSRWRSASASAGSRSEARRVLGEAPGGLEVARPVLVVDRQRLGGPPADTSAGRAALEQRLPGRGRILVAPLAAAVQRERPQRVGADDRVDRRRASQATPPIPDARAKHASASSSRPSRS